MEAQQDNSLRLNWWGHSMTDKDTPTLDDEGDYTSYAKCATCGAVENTNESVQICPQAKYIHISVLAKELQKQWNIHRHAGCPCSKCQYANKQESLQKGLL